MHPSFAEDDDVVVNPSVQPKLDELVAGRVLSRRGLLAGGMGWAAGVMLGGCTVPTRPAAIGQAPAGPLRLGFAPVAKHTLDQVSVPDGYRLAVLHALGDPLQPGYEAWRGDGTELPASYDQRVGDGHDGMHFFGLGHDGGWDSRRSDRGLLAVNHEYVPSPFVLHPGGITPGAQRVGTEAHKEMLAHGVSVTEVARSADGRTTMVKGSPYNRRVTALTPMELAGPAKGHRLMCTRHSPQGTHTRGTQNNCAHGHTPWGTYLTCEENWTNTVSRAAGDDVRRTAAEVAALNRYGLPEGRNSPYRWHTAGTDDLHARWSSSVTAGSADADYRHVANTFGWVVEIDPFQPASTPVKRTALGRFSHEGAWPAPVVAGQPVVFYMGDDARNEYIYKFVSAAAWDPVDARGGLAAGSKYLDHGTLYVARFDADGTGEWLALSHGLAGLDAGNATYGFADQGDVLIHARLAADARGATPMDRPEWGAVNPLNGEVYMTLTNNRNRVGAAEKPVGAQLHTDAANPRSYADTSARPDGTLRVNRGNVNGHIIRWREAGGQAAAIRFQWDVFLFGAQADAPADVNLSGLTDANDFSSPDGMCFDSRGLLWIQTDDAAYTDVSNCMLLAAVPGVVGDGRQAPAAGGTSTLAGAPVTPATLRRFLVGPKGCEITGVTLTPDHRNMFVNIQHPGEGMPADFKAHRFGSHWPASQQEPASLARPRSATVVVTREDGGEIGT
ncbi:MAG TPA: PhoX family phosphatase [Burkholderiaceae bacterium]|nr:PhoX family phosphatase [Burkholderiaceae bacterium]